LEFSLPFRYEHEINFIVHLHPSVRFILPFILVLPFLVINNIYLIISVILITLIINFATHNKISRILKKIKNIIPFMILITIFIPFYVGNTILFQLRIGIVINVYNEGLNLALLLFLRIFGSIFVFMSFFSYLTYSEFIESLTKLRVIPSVFIGSLVIMLHYIPILANSNKKILEAQELRGKKITTYRERFKTHAYIMGKSIVKNLERSEKLYECLKMRGFTGKMTFGTKRIKLIDVSILILFFSMMIYLIFFIDLKSVYQGVFALFLL